ncbi:chorismate synthase [Treponema berlinense]|uniref:chorismate synthase n=1 Tax=Treponema berlinense TaxID=225004 RepID=UPI0026F2450F|nr:chorismate synthase [Treponema berlinense]
MSGNTFGKLFKITTFGESHGTALGGVIDGVPAGIEIDQTKIQAALDRRRPGQSAGGQFNASVTARKEADKIEILSGIFEGKSEGTSIGFMIRNESQHSKDYSNLAATFRPGHADLSYFLKYGFRDYRGGGRSSGRETAARVAAGEVARQVLEHFLPEIKITAYTQRAAGISITKTDFSQIEQNPLRAPDNDAAAKMNEKIEELRKNGDSAGGIIACRVTGVPAGLGECVFDKLDALLAHGVLSIGAVKGIEFGAGFEACDLTGSQNNDQMRASEDGKKVNFLTDNAGGILGGISSGSDIFFRVAVKPVPSIFKEQKTVSLSSEGKFSDTDLKIEGRHDVCLCPRIVPVIEAMTAVTLCDLFLQDKAVRP